MGDAPTTFIFEDPKLAELYCRFQPRATDRVATFEALVLRLLEDERCPPTEREALMLSQRREGETEAQLRRNFETIERLREAQIINAEHVAFAFAELPETPKNLRLRELFQFYLESDLVRDWTFLAFSLVEHLKDGIFNNPFTENVTFVPGAAPAPLFLETTRAFVFASGVAEVRTVSFAELGDTDRIRRPLIVSGGATDRLDALARRIAAGAKYVAFDGAAHELAYLKLRVSSLGGSAEVRSGNGDDLLSRLRGDATIPLTDRLRLGAILVDNSRRLEGTDPRDVPDQLERQALLTPRERDLLKNLSTPTLNPKVSSFELLPVIPLPSFPGFLPLYYLGETFWSRPETDALLKEAECASLARAGFTLRSPVRDLNALLQPSARRATLFTARPTPEGNIRAIRLRPIASEPPSGEESFLAPEPAGRLSASQLESFARCPSHYFFANRLRLRRRQFLDEESFSLLFGQAVHLTLERNYIMNRGEHFREVEDVFKTALATLAPGLAAADPYHVILCESFRKIAVNLPTIEAQVRALAGGTTPIAAELKFEFPLDELVVSGKIDRLDRLANGELLVLDYKTGNVDFTPDHIAQGNHFQALVYLLAVAAKYSDPVAGVLFYDLKKAEVRRGILVQEALPKEAKKLLTRGHLVGKEKFDELIARGREHIAVLAKAIRAGNFAPTPSPKVCNYCDFPSFCRRSGRLA